MKLRSSRLRQPQLETSGPGLPLMCLARSDGSDLLEVMYSSILRVSVINLLPNIWCKEI